MEEVATRLYIPEEVNAHFIEVCRGLQRLATSPCALVIGLEVVDGVAVLGLWKKFDEFPTYSEEDISAALADYPAGLTVVGVLYASNAARVASLATSIPQVPYGISFYADKLSAWEGQHRRLLEVLPATDLATKISASHIIVRVLHTMLVYLVHDEQENDIDAYRRQIINGVLQQLPHSSISFASGCTVDLHDGTSATATLSVEEGLAGYLRIQTAIPSSGETFGQKKRGSAFGRVVKKLKGKKGKRSSSAQRQQHGVPDISNAQHNVHNAVYSRTYGDVTEVSMELPMRLVCAPSSVQPPVTVISIPLTFDVVAYAPRTLEITLLGDALQRSMIRKLEQLVGQLTMDDLRDTQQDTTVELRMFQFEPRRVFAPISAGFKLKRSLRSLGVDEAGSGYGWQPDWEDDEVLVNCRRKLHEAFGFPQDRPMFRTVCAIDLTAKAMLQIVGDHLLNVHVGLLPPAAPGMRVRLVDGDYAYFHYLQDNIDDRGWGCAYRSLQIIVSWYVLNRYKDVPIPTHTDIQQALVDVGDKPPGFIGSRDWIGSLEVGFYLGEVLKIEWRNLMVNRGPALAEKARELAEHFIREGTPVMIGGGELALILLGIAWNEDTGEVRFLILDPHYTGTDTIDDIQLKPSLMAGYRGTACGWRSPQSFSKEGFYSLCLPSRPRMI